MGMIFMVIHRDSDCEGLCVDLFGWCFQIFSCSIFEMGAMIPIDTYFSRGLKTTDQLTGLQLRDVAILIQSLDWVGGSSFKDVSGQKLYCWVIRTDSLYRCRDCCLKGEQGLVGKGGIFSTNTLVVFLISAAGHFRQALCNRLEWQY